MTVNYHRQRRYGKPLPAKRDIKAQLQFFQLVFEAGENENETDKKRDKISYDVVNGRIQRKE